jgi:hypothetical protein
MSRLQTEADAVTCLGAQGVYVRVTQMKGNIVKIQLSVATSVQTWADAEIPDNCPDCGQP